jgi:hypothetical protein
MQPVCKVLTVAAAGCQRSAAILATFNILCGEIPRPALRRTAADILFLSRLPQHPFFLLGTRSLRIAHT